MTRAYYSIQTNNRIIEQKVLIIKVLSKMII